MLAILQLSSITHGINPDENSKDLPNSINNEDYLRRRKRPLSQGPGSGYPSGCKFGPKGGTYKTDGQGRTFFDLAYLNFNNNQQYNINCGNVGSGHPGDNGVHESPGTNQQGGHKPGGHKPGGHRPGGHGGHGGHGGNNGHGGFGGHGGNGGHGGLGGLGSNGGTCEYSTIFIRISKLTQDSKFNI